MPTFAEQVLNRAQSEFIKSRGSSHPDLKSTIFLKADDNGNLKGPFKKLIDHLQLAKYPHPPFTCKQQSIEINGTIRPVTYIKAEGQINLSTEQLHQVNVNSLLLRKVALAATLEAYATQHVKGKNQLKAIRSQLEQLVNESIQEAIEQAKDPKLNIDAYDETNKFINKLGTILNNNTQLKNHNEAVKNIKNYERYVLSEMNAGRIIINESTLDDKNIVQMDIPLDAQLTEAQKKEYLQIISSKKPEWFQKLNPEEQRWYQDRVKRATESPDGWKNFAQEVYSTSAMQQALEMKNARKNYFFIDGQLQSESTKNATLNPIEVPKKERQKLTIQNAEQLIENQIQDATEQFRNHWGLSPDAKLPGKIMIASQSLLSPFLGIADDKMIKAQKEAIEHLANDPRYKDKYQIVFGNDAVNIFRKAQTINWKYTDNVMDYSRDLMGKLQLAGVDSNHPQMKLMNEALRRLEELKDAPDLKDRNKAAFKTALTSILIEASGGKVSTNCKSGKDRTGLEELYHNAMLTYYSVYNELPGYNDPPEKRERFIKIFSHLFNTLKIHESASGNTVGAFGIKDSAKMLCPDIAKALAANYTASNSRANINKTEEAFVKKITKSFDQGNAVVEADVFKDFAQERLERRKHELEQKSGNKKKKIDALDQLILDVKNSQDLILTLNKFLSDEKNKSIFSSKLGVREDLTIKLIKKIIKECEANKKLIEENNQHKKREQELQQKAKKTPEKDIKQHVQELRTTIKGQQSEILLVQESLVQQKKNLEQEKNKLLQFKIELARVEQDLGKNTHKLAEITAELIVQRNQLEALSTALSHEKEIAKQIDEQLNQEIESFNQLNTTLESQKSDLYQLEEELQQQKEEVVSITEEINTQTTTLEQLRVDHQKENNKLNILTQLQKEKPALDELIHNLNKAQEQKGALESKKAGLKKIQEEIVEKEVNRSRISKVLASIVSFFKSLFSSSRNAMEDSRPVTPKSKEIEELTSEIDKLEKHIELQKQIVQNQKDKVERLEAGIDEKAKEDINQGLKEQTVKVMQLDTKITKAEQHIEQLKENEEQGRSRIKELEGKINRQKELISNSKFEVEGKKLSIEEQRMHLSTQQGSIETMEGDIVNKQQSIKEKEMSTDVYKKAIHKDETEVHNLHGKITKQEDKIQQQEKLYQGQVDKSAEHPIHPTSPMKQRLQESKSQAKKHIQQDDPKNEITPIRLR
ncbi:hypothetical protein [Legionella fallonii]|uniref:Uncharacterized protein n=1 Tax=Legionella fallonii LLAP-10 TaxID=1212491 RepID=A0A098G4N0_9GAMM|nr:hypothetical protein [Legionella fallonii]CEG56949.1 protein of unknown function [9 coiled-coil domains] [Legionella fallonii LLAP-10]